MHSRPADRRSERTTLVCQAAPGSFSSDAGQPLERVRRFRPTQANAQSSQGRLGAWGCLILCGTNVFRLNLKLFTFLRFSEKIL